MIYDWLLIIHITTGLIYVGYWYHLCIYLFFFINLLLDYYNIYYCFVKNRWADFGVNVNQQ